MSCENPSVDKDALMARRTKFDKTKQCVKCKERTGHIVIRHAVYCKSCFFPLISTRFRKSLEPSINPTPDGPRRKALKASGSFLIGLSGGLGSTVMLDLVAKTYFGAPSVADLGEEAPPLKPKGGKEHPRNMTGKDSEIWRGIPAVCYVEVCGAFPGAEDRTERVRQVVERYATTSPPFKFDFISLRLEDAFDLEWWKRVGGGSLASSAQSLGMDMTNENLLLSPPPSSTPILALQTYLSSLPTQTAIHSATQTLVRLLLLYTAASRRASHVLLGTSLTSLSVNLISGIAQGAGFSVAEEAMEEWRGEGKSGEVTPPIRIVRPLRDVGMKECAIWAWWCGLRVVGRERYLGGTQGIGSLTRNFITGLERDYPATVSTIARTCAKLTPKEGSDGICLLCERPAQHGVQEWKSRISIRSYNDAPLLPSGHERPPHLANAVDRPQHRTEFPPSSRLTPHLCYACHTTLTSRSSRGNVKQSSDSRVVPLPLWVGASLSLASTPEDSSGEVWATRRMGDGEMKAAIGDLLLNDS